MKNIDQLLACLSDEDRAKLIQAQSDFEALFAPFRDDYRRPICETWAARNKQVFISIIDGNACFTAASTCRFMLLDTSQIHMRMKTYRHPVRLHHYTQCREWIETDNIDSINEFLKLFCKSSSDIVMAAQGKARPFIIDLAFLCD